MKIGDGYGLELTRRRPFDELQAILAEEHTAVSEEYGRTESPTLDRARGTRDELGLERPTRDPF